MSSRRSVPDNARPASGDRPFEQIVERLAIDIISGRHATGEQLPNETTLGLDISVSRTAFREALKYLTAKGLIEAKPRSGTRVRPRSAWNLLDPDILRWSLHAGPSLEFVRDLFELRRNIEPTAARLAALRHTVADLARLETALLGMELNEPIGPAAIDADLRFHEALFLATGNPALACLKDIVTTTILWSQRIKRPIGPSQFVDSLATHRRIFEAVRDRDGELAAAQTVMLVVEATNSTTAAMLAQPTQK
jgi:DNA-binding FadR family transcriptional regulator